jgi:hypothetical protein
MKDHNATAAYFEMARAAQSLRIGATFHRAAPTRAARHAESSPVLAGLAWVAPVLALAAFFVVGF